MRCRKVRYRTRLDAEIVLLRIWRKRSADRRPKLEARAYACPYCRGWHLTSQKPQNA